MTYTPPLRRTEMTQRLVDYVKNEKDLDNLIGERQIAIDKISKVEVPIPYDLAYDIKLMEDEIERLKTERANIKEEIKRSLPDIRKHIKIGEFEIWLRPNKVDIEDLELMIITPAHSLVQLA